MSSVSPRLSWLQRFILRSAWKKVDRKNISPEKVHVFDLTFIFPSNENRCSNLGPVLSEWLARRERGKIRLIIPSAYETAASERFTGADILAYSDEDVRKNSTLKAAFISRLKEKSSAASLLLEPDYLICTELIFAHSQTVSRLALHHDARSEKIQFLVKDIDSLSFEKKVNTLLQMIDRLDWETSPAS